MMKSTSTIQVASCQFHQFGSAGLQQSLNALCILTHNILVDKVENIVIIKLHVLEVNNCVSENRPTFSKSIGYYKLYTIWSLAIMRDWWL